VQWTSDFLGVFCNRGTNIENCALLQKGHFRPEGECAPHAPPGSAHDPAISMLQYHSDACYQCQAFYIPPSVCCNIIQTRVISVRPFVSLHQYAAISFRHMLSVSGLL
jgi:hypothetical protein